MRNDWNIKKEIRDVDDYPEPVDDFYYPETFETLRLKLIDKLERQIWAIEDDNNIPIAIQTSCKFYPKQMINFINKCFGVEK